MRASSPLGYFTDPITAPVLQAGRKNQDVRVAVLAPAWVRLQLVDELPKSRVSLLSQATEVQVNDLIIHVIQLL